MFRLVCPSCGFMGVYARLDIVEEGVYRYTCEVCNTKLLSLRLGSVRCPVCNTRYIAGPDRWILVERGATPEPATRTPVIPVAGMPEHAEAGTLEDAVRRVEDAVRGVIAATIVGGLIGTLAHALTRLERAN
jgi:predicted RNA-binding Zn-ribbon protein involved in translation (DUF1610 family)